MSAPVLEARGLTHRYRLRGHGRRGPAVTALSDVFLVVRAGQTVGLVGESGSGKTTLARLLTRLERPTAGLILWNGADVTALAPRRLRPLRRAVQLVFQDPHGSLDPRMAVGETVAEPLVIHGRPPAVAARRAAELLERVGLGAAVGQRHPHELSGGQRQRVGIARALALEPDVIVLDEPVSALDVSVQAQILALLAELQAETGMAYLLISHDLAVVRQLAGRVAVLRAGQVVEEGDTEQIYQQPGHPYTQALLDAVPIPDPARRRGHAPPQG